MAGPRSPRQTLAARSSGDVRPFFHLIKADKVIAIHKFVRLRHEDGGASRVSRLEFGVRPRDLGQRISVCDIYFQSLA
jgi:hypothetical protein